MMLAPPRPLSQFSTLTLTPAPGFQSLNPPSGLMGLTRPADTRTYAPGNESIRERVEFLCATKARGAYGEDSNAKQ